MQWAAGPGKAAQQITSILHALGCMGAHPGRRPTVIPVITHFVKRTSAERLAHSAWWP